MANGNYAASCRKALHEKVEGLPVELRQAWDRGCRRKAILPEEAMRRSGFAGSKPAKPPGLWAPATALMVVAHVGSLHRAAARENRPTHPDVLFERRNLVELFDKPLRDLSGASKILHVRAAKSFCEQILRRRTEGLVSLQLRIRANETARDYSGLLREYAHYRNAALALEPHMAPGEPHDVTSAVMSREKAIACLAVSIDPRLGEISGLAKADVEVDGKHVVIIIPAAISKERVSQSRALDEECAKAFLEYHDRARPFLCRRRPEGTVETPALWLTCDGEALGQKSVAQALSKVLATASGAPAGARILRKVMASREDIADGEVGSALGHSLSSTIGIDVYTMRDERRARRELVAMLESFDE